MVIETGIPDNCDVKKKAHTKVDKYQGLIEEMKLWKFKASVAPVVIGALRDVIPKL